MRTALLLVQLWALVQTTCAYSTSPRLSMCPTFHVAHGSSVNETGEDVKIVLRKVTSPGIDLEEVSCYMPSQEYTVELKSFGHTIGGFLLQADRGRFPFDTSTWRFPETASGSPLVVSGPCTKSVSHKELLRNENSTPKLKFGYKSPKGRQLFKFRFTVVFDYGHHVEDVNVSIPSCLSPPVSYTKGLRLYICEILHHSFIDEADKNILRKVTSPENNTEEASYYIIVMTVTLAGLGVIFVYFYRRQLLLRSKRQTIHPVQEENHKASSVMIIPIMNRSYYHQCKEL